MLVPEGDTWPTVPGGRARDWVPGRGNRGEDKVREEEGGAEGREGQGRDTVMEGREESKGSSWEQEDMEAEAKLQHTSRRGA